MPTRERGRPARTIARYGLRHLRRLVRPASAAWVSSGLAIAVHADRPADWLQHHADATQTPSGNKVAGGTPAFPGGVPPGAPRLPPTGSKTGSALSPTPPQGGSDNRALNAASGPIPGRDVIHVSGLLWRGCPPGNAGVPPAPLPGTASGISAPWFDPHLRRGSPRALPLRFTPTGPLTGCNITLTLRKLHPGIRLRAGRPRSRGVSLPGRRVGPLRLDCGHAPLSCRLPLKGGVITVAPNKASVIPRPSSRPSFPPNVPSNTRVSLPP